VVELHNRIIKDNKSKEQLTYYSSGIGTSVPSSQTSFADWIANGFDSAVAWCVAPNNVLPSSLTSVGLLSSISWMPTDGWQTITNLATRYFFSVSRLSGLTYVF
jgi:hypothetical protein